MIIYVLLLTIVFELLLLYAYSSYRVYRQTSKSQLSEKSGREEYYSRANCLKKFIMNWIQSLIRYNLFLISYIPSHHIRIALYQYVFKMDIGKRVVIYYGAELRDPWNIHIGDGSIIGDKALLDGRCGLYIGKNVNFGTGISVYTMQHDVDDRYFGIEYKSKPVHINEHAWISSGVTVLPGVTVGEGGVAAAGAVVTKDIPPFEVWGGVPAKKLRNRNTELQYTFDGSHLHFL